MKWKNSDIFNFVLSLSFNSSYRLLHKETKAPNEMLWSTNTINTNQLLIILELN